MPLLTGNNKIQLYMGPHTIGGPDNLETLLVDFIKNAKKSLEIAVQELDSMKISTAIIEARLRGVRVKVILEADYLRNRKYSSNPFRPDGKQEINRKIFSALLRANIDVKTDFNPYTLHSPVSIYFF